MDGVKPSLLRRRKAAKLFRLHTSPQEKFIANYIYLIKPSIFHQMKSIDG